MLLDRFGTRILTVGEWTQDDGTPACAAWKPELEIVALEGSMISDADPIRMPDGTCDSETLFGMFSKDP